MTRIEGIIGYLVTPFSGFEVDESALRDMVDHLIEAGVHGLAPLGSTGESAYLDNPEWEQVARVTVKHTAGRVPVIVGASALTTAKALSFATRAQELGADAVMVLPLSYWKLTEDEIFQHYKAISDGISIPIMAYNNPGTSGVDMSPELLVRMVRDIENVTMVKESSGDIQRMHRIHELTDGEVPFFNGCNPLALEALCAGAADWCTAAPNLIAGLNLELWNAVSNGRLEDAKSCFYRQLPLLRFILEGGLPATIKAALRLQGLDAGDPRLPLTPLSEEGIGELSALMAAVRSWKSGRRVAWRSRAQASEPGPRCVGAKGRFSGRRRAPRAARPFRFRDASTSRRFP